MGRLVQQSAGCWSPSATSRQPVRALTYAVLNTTAMAARTQTGNSLQISRNGSDCERKIWHVLRAVIVTASTALRGYDFRLAGTQSRGIAGTEIPRFAANRSPELRIVAQGHCA